MTDARVPLYERLPEIHKIRDSELTSPGQLRSYLRLFEEAFGAVHENIESLYHDLFVETADDWVVPYIGDLLGTSHLSGDPWTIRADVADTVGLRRRKGTLGAIELLTFDLTRWGVHCVELRERLVWHQHLNHQRPDEGGRPAFSLPTVSHMSVLRGGTVTLRDPAMLSLLGTPFDPFGHTPDVRPPSIETIRYNLPNLAVFLWRLQAYRIAVSRPMSRGTQVIAGAVAPDAPRICRFDIHPLGQPLRLFNTGRYDADRRPPVLTALDEVPGPIPTPRLTDDSPAGSPAAYATAETYDATDPNLASLELSDVGLQLHLPEATFPLDAWTFRGANLCAWEAGLHPPLRDREIAVDPVIGRIVVGAATAGEATALTDDLLVTFTYGAVGPVGAHPVARPDAPTEWLDETVDLRPVNFHQNPNGLAEALGSIQNSVRPVVVEIADSMVHDVDLAAVTGTVNEAGGPNLRLNRSLIIRAADGERPVIRLGRALRFRPTNVTGATQAEQQVLDAVMDRLTVRLEGVYMTRGPGFPADQPLIARAAVHALEVVGCMLDPGGFRQLDGARAPAQTSMSLTEPYGFTDPDDEREFKQTPEINLLRSVAGPILLDPGYLLFVTDSILDAGRGVKDDPNDAFVVSSASDPVNAWGPPTQVSGATFLGRMRVFAVNGRGGIWVHALEALNNQRGCVKFSYFSGVGDRLPQNHGCVHGSDVALRFVAEAFGAPAYGQLAFSADDAVRERGPRDDAMGAFGFLLEAHKWRNLEIRYREFKPVGIGPLLIPVT
jgi:hypothetical protein